MSDDLTYQVVWSLEVVQYLKAVATKAADIGQDQNFAAALKAIQLRLRRDPRNFGEMNWSRESVEKYHAILLSVAVHFNVDTERRFVLVSECGILSGNYGL